MDQSWSSGVPRAMGVRAHAQEGWGVARCRVSDRAEAAHDWLVSTANASEAASTSESCAAVTVSGVTAQSAGAAGGNQAPVPATTMTWAAMRVVTVVAMPGKRPCPSVAIQAAGTAISAVRRVRTSRRRSGGRRRVGDAQAEKEPEGGDEASQPKGNDRRPGEVGDELCERDRRSLDGESEEAADGCVGELASDKPAQCDAEREQSPGCSDLRGDADQARPLVAIGNGTQLCEDLLVAGVGGKVQRGGEERDAGHEQQSGAQDDARPPCLPCLHPDRDGQVHLIARHRVRRVRRARRTRARCQRRPDRGCRFSARG